ncbi:MAG: zinc-ribbon domain-containing protein [Candidatus Heimdallarchaeota archaeon]|nr:zinc-ribbon domain-containing protein [Candidatus Heimdallarchaeota archaeon]
MSATSSKTSLETSDQRKVCLTSQTTWAFFTYASYISFFFNIVAYPAHVILLPYYLIAILARGKPPQFLNKWVYFNSHGLFRAKHQEGEVWRDYWCLYYIYFGFILNFVLWLLAITLLSLIFTIFVFIEEWRIITNVMYRLTFGSWIKIVNDPEELQGTSTDDVTEGGTEPKVADEESEIKGKKKEVTVCPVCGVEIDSKTTYCPKCGSYIE